MTSRLRWSPAAERDLQQIWRYVADEISAARADEQIRKIRNVSQTLRDWPFSGRSREELMPGLRSMPMAPYVPFYRIVQDSVEIVRVLHGRRDTVAIFVNR